MSMSITGLGPNTSMLAQLQKMQQQMRMMTEQQHGLRQDLQQNVNKSPVDNGLKANSQVNGINEVKDIAPVDNVGAFANMLNQAFETVNNLQNDSTNKQTRFDLGDRSMTLSDVMIASQKASISFDATIQVRNKMLEAYRTISQMQI